MKTRPFIVSTFLVSLTLLVNLLLGRVQPTAAHFRQVEQQDTPLLAVESTGVFPTTIRVSEIRNGVQEVENPATFSTPDNVDVLIPQRLMNLTSNGAFVDSTQSLGNSESWEPALWDMDGDGDLDAFVANNNGANRVWLNDGKGVFSDSGQSLGSSDSLAVASGDVDGDGDLDAFVANYNGQANRVWLNDGTGTFSDSNQNLGSSWSHGVALGDIDGDGDLDAFVVNANGQADEVWLNDGAGTFSDSGQRLYSGMYGMDVALGDVDGDSDLDAIVVNAGEAANKVWLNDGLGTFSDNGQELGNSWSYGVALGDVDGDGDLDAFVTNLDAKASINAANKVWLNDGTGIFSDSGQNLGSLCSYDVALGDLDGDSDLDAFVANTKGQPNKVWFNDGRGTFSDSGQSLGNSDSAGVALGDMDGDGDLDAFVANGTRHGQANKVWLNQGQIPPLPTTYSISGRVTDASSSCNRIQGVKITDQFGNTAFTNADGYYVLLDLVPDTYFLTASKSGYTFTPASRTVSVPPSATWQDFVGVKTTSKPPIVLVHGWTGSCESFREMPDWLSNDGYHVECPTLTTGWGHTPPVEVNAIKLKEAINRAKSDTEASKVILIAHSMGGLVSRAYLETMWYPQLYDDVEKVIMLGTPNAGAEVDVLASLLGPGVCVWQPALCEFSVSGMKLWNLVYSQRAPGTSYHLIGGDEARLPISWLIPGKDDGMVAVSSVHGIDGRQAQKLVTHAQHSGDPGYFGERWRAYDNCIRPILDGSAPDSSCQRSPTGLMAIVTEPSSPVETTRIQGEITTGQTLSYTLDVDSPSQSAFVLSWITGTLSFSLTTPNATSINPAVAASDPNVAYSTSSAVDMWTSSAAYVFTETTTGTWTLAVSGVDTDGAEIPFVARALLDSSLRLSLPEYALAYQMGDSLPVTATLSSNGVGLAGATLTATLWRPDGITDTLTLLDDGAHHDGVAGDGVYGENYTVPDAHGYYLVRVTASGTQGSTPFTREAQGMFMVAVDTATLTHSYSDYGIDANGNGLYESLAIDVGVQATQASTYTLSAWLVGAGQAQIAQATHYTTLITGTQTVTLKFDGDLIRDGALDGPYTVTEVYLIDNSGAMVLADQGTDVWVTQAYEHKRFGTSYHTYLPLVLRNY